MPTQRSQSGFVYAAQCGDDPSWVKIGCTRRTPDRRLEELNAPSVLTPFVFLDARFLWRAHASEYHLHKVLEEKFEKQKEFFKMTPDQVQSFFDELEKWDAQTAPKVKKKGWKSLSQKDFEKRIQSHWSDQEVQGVDIDQRDWLIEDLDGVGLLKKIEHKKLFSKKSLEKMAAGGDHQASYVLAEKLAMAAMGEVLPKQDWLLSDALFRASEKQGQPHARLRSAFLATFLPGPTEPALKEWWSSLAPWHELLINAPDETDPLLNLPEVVQHCFKDEQDLWKYFPGRAHSWGAFTQSSPKLPPREFSFH